MTNGFQKTTSCPLNSFCLYRTHFRYNELVTLRCAKMAAKRKALTIDFKRKLLDEVDKGRKKKDICDEYSIAKTTLSTIIKNRAKLEDLDDIVPTRKRARSTKHSDIDEAVMIWFKQALSSNVPVGGPLLKTKANELAKQFGINDWEASDGWMHWFKQRHGLVFKTICGESASVTPSMTDKWFVDTLPTLIAHYEPKDIFNVDETGLFYQCLPNKTFTFRGENVSRAVKESKQRLTMLVGANIDGSEKVDLLIIGKSANPRCFKGVKSLPVDYHSNTKAWMTSTLWTEWIKAFDKKMQLSGRKILLIIDNCPAHPNVPNLSNTEVVYLPPNTTSKTQPCDQGIIQALK